MELPAGDPPEWVLLLPAGELPARDGRRWRLDDPAAVVDASRSRAGSTDLVFDYGHQTEYARENGREAPAAGWIRALDAREDGIWGRVEWTERARAAIAAREYRYYSPTFTHTKTGRITALLRAALTNTPALDLPALAKEGDLQEELKRLLEALGLSAEPTAAEVDAALARIDPAPIDRAALTAALGLETTATGEQIVTAAQAAADPIARVPRAEFDRVSAELQALQTADAEKQAIAAVDDAIKAGKLAPAQRDWALAAARKDLQGFAAFVAGAPVIVTPAKRDPHSPAPRALSGEERAVCQALNVSEDAYRRELESEVH